MKFLRYLTEKLPLSVARIFTSIYDRKLYNKQFGGKDRIYLELGHIEELDIKPPETIKDLLDDLGYEIINYKAGLASKKGDKKNLIRIGKILSDKKVKEKAYKEKSWAAGVLDIALKQFSTDPIRQLKQGKDLMAVISRHPYDIAGMSTDRGWTSCMSVDLEIAKVDALGIAYKSPVWEEIKGGSIVAYLIDKNDPNIQKPIGRVAIKPFVNMNDESILMVVCDKGYGTVNVSFMQTVKKWVAQKFNKSAPVGTYTLKTGVYGGDYKTTYIERTSKKEVKPMTMTKLLKMKDLISFINSDDNIKTLISSSEFMDTVTFEGIKKLTKLIEDKSPKVDPDIYWRIARLMKNAIFYNPNSPSPSPQALVFYYALLICSDYGITKNLKMSFQSNRTTLQSRKDYNYQGLVDYAVGEVMAIRELKLGGYKFARDAVELLLKNFKKGHFRIT